MVLPCKGLELLICNKKKCDSRKSLFFSFYSEGLLSDIKYDKKAIKNLIKLWKAVYGGKNEQVDNIIKILIRYKELMDEKR